MTQIPTADAVFRIFKQINRIPRPSHYEDRMAMFLCRFAQKLGLEHQRDSQNNVVIRKPATPGYEHAETIVLLNHMDMVCVAKGGTKYDPLHDGIKAVEQDGWIHAQGTSLGADNGIGLAMALAILEDDTIVHGPLEVLTTTNEEDGMTGAAALAPDFIQGRRVINLDSEDYDTITVGAAGAIIQQGIFPIRMVPAPAGYSFISINISGGRGGHSGVDINRGRCNVIRLLCQIMEEIDGQFDTWELISFGGGNAAASIPSEASAVIGVPVEEVQNLKTAVRSTYTRLVKPYKTEEKTLKLNAAIVGQHTHVVMIDDAVNLIDALLNVPCGVISMRPDMPDTVMTSNNVGVVEMNEYGFRVLTHTRSFHDGVMNDVARQIEQRMRAAHAEVTRVMEAPAWAENAESPYIQLVSNVFQHVLGFEPRRVAMHFVLEAGYYVQKFPGIEIASIGPRIVEPHSPSERVEVSTIHDIWRVTLELLRTLAKR